MVDIQVNQGRSLGCECEDENFVNETTTHTKTDILFPACGVIGYNLILRIDIRGRLCIDS